MTVPFPGASADGRSTALDVRLRQLESAGTPIRVAMIGAGAAACSIALHLTHSVPGIRLAAIANRAVDRARHAFGMAGVAETREARTTTELEDALAAGRPVVTGDAELVCHSPHVDAVIEATGTIEYATGIVLTAIDAGRHVVLVNAEVDATLGPLLARRAARRGVVLTNIDGDEPGVAMTLLRYLRSLGLRPVAAGNVKGMVDVHRTPDTQRAFAERHGIDVRKATSFADATKLSFEATVLANATGFRVGRRGMYGPRCADVRDLASLLPADDMLDGGLVDYALGAAPHTGAFVIVHEDDPRKREKLAYGKMGDGPFYVFHTPFHLPHIQVASTIARAVLESDATVVARDQAVCETVTMAKRDLRAGEVLDGIGGFRTYGLVDNADAAAAIDALPMGASEGCRLVRDVAMHTVVTYHDVEVPGDRRLDALLREQRRARSTTTRTR